MLSNINTINKQDFLNTIENKLNSALELISNDQKYQYMIPEIELVRVGTWWMFAEQDSNEIHSDTNNFEIFNNIDNSLKNAIEQIILLLLKFPNNIEALCDYGDILVFKCGIILKILKYSPQTFDNSLIDADKIYKESCAEAMKTYKLALDIEPENLNILVSLGDLNLNIVPLYYNQPEALNIIVPDAELYYNKVLFNKDCSDKIEIAYKLAKCLSYLPNKLVECKTILEKCKNAILRDGLEYNDDGSVEFSLLVREKDWFKSLF